MIVETTDYSLLNDEYHEPKLRHSESDLMT